MGDALAPGLRGRFGRRWCLAAVALSLVTAPAARAQYRDQLLRLPARDAAATPLPVTSDHRNPLLAGALSGLLLPGLGSFYAGHPRHGVVHVAVTVASVTGMMLGAVDCIISSWSNDDTTHRSCRVADASAWVFVGNWGWSIVSAVNDARAHNRTAAGHGP